MMVIEDRAALEAWLAGGATPPATILGVDVRGMAAGLAGTHLVGSVFLGCAAEPGEAAALCAAGSKVVEETGLLPPSLPAFATGIYTVPDLYRGLQPDGSGWEVTPDHDGYAWFMQAPAVPRPLDVAQMLAARLHDTVQERDVVAACAAQSGRNHGRPRLPAPAIAAECCGRQA